MPDPLSKMIRGLADAGIASMEQLEVAIAVQRGEQAGCTIDRLASAMRTSPAQAEASLRMLETLGVVGHDERDPACWRIVRTDLLPAIHATSKAMASNRQDVVNHFYARRLESLRAFSNAFRLRKDT